MPKKRYTINLFSTSDWDLALTDLRKLQEAFGKDKNFLNFIANKIMMELQFISSERLGGIAEYDIAGSEVDRYRSNHTIDIGDDIIIVGNTTRADLSHVSSKTLDRYPEGISVSKLIEFGMGASGSDNEEFGWQTEMNENRDYSIPWFYERNGMLYSSIGMNGKFIYYELGQVVKKNIQSWFNEYIDSILTGG